MPTNLDNEKEEIEHKLLLLFQRMSVCAATHQGKDAEWIDGQCVTPTTATEEAEKIFDEYTQSKLKAFAGELEAAIGEDTTDIDLASEVATSLVRSEIRQSLNAIKEKYKL